MKNKKSNEHRQLTNQQIMFSIIIIAILLVLVVGITYSFFNYTRTGSANTVKTGRIYFNAEQDAAVTLSDLFPITTNGNVTSSTPGVGSLSIHVTGNTSYAEGVEYLVKAVNVTGNNGTNLPISISIGYEANNEKTIGTEDEDYFTNRGGSTSRYKVLSSDTIEEGTDLVVGYIAPDANGTGIDGNIIIMAYLDAQNIAITDTNPEQTVRTVNNNLTNNQLTACASILSSYNATTTWCGGTGTITYETEDYTFQELLDANILTSGQITSLLEAGIITEYTDGTTDTWVNGRTVFTTEEWNALQASGVSFQVKVEANEGTWVPAPIPTIASCPGCKFIYTTNMYYYGGANNANATLVSTLTGVTNDYRTLNKNYFLGFTETQDGKIDRAYACGIKGEDPNNGTAFCIEGSLGDASGGNSTTRAEVYSSNNTVLYTLYGQYNNGTGCSSNEYGDTCSGVIGTFSYNDGDARVFLSSTRCRVSPYGEIDCN